MDLLHVRWIHIDYLYTTNTIIFFVLKTFTGTEYLIIQGVIDNKHRLLPSLIAIVVEI